jgi:hypothetical protein
MKHMYAVSLPASVALIACLLWSAGLPAGQPAPKDKTSDEQNNAQALDAKELAEFALAHSRARDALLAAEARLALLSEKVFDSRLVVRYHGECDTPFSVVRIELDLDGASAYRNDFNKAPTAQAIKLFDGYLPPGRHVLRLRVFARGPDDPPGSLPGYFAGSGLTVHLREKSTSTASFDVEQDGDSPGSRVLSNREPDGSWNLEIDASFETRAK